MHVVHDERAAGFVALGLGLGGTPAIVLCTSGTAAANLHPAVVEAGLSDVPMLVLTADRPPELRDVGAPQTIDQTHLYGRSRALVPRSRASPTTRRRRRGARSPPAAGGRRPRRPGAPQPAVPRAARRPTPGAAAAAPSRAGGHTVAGGLDVRRPASRCSTTGAASCSPAAAGRRRELSTPFVAATGWPVLADPTSRLRVARRRRRGVRRPAPPRADGRRRCGPTWSCASAARRRRRCSPSGSPRPARTLVQVGGPGVDRSRPHGRRPPRRRRRLPAARPSGSAGVGDAAWRERWLDADAAAEAAIDDVLGPEAPLSEPAVARTHRPSPARRRRARRRLVDAGPRPRVVRRPTARAHANRGANGIDGVVSTALGVALRGVPTVALVGDIAFVHDSRRADGARARRGADLRIVVVDNDGGGIFSFLPQAATLAGRALRAAVRHAARHRRRRPRRGPRPRRDDGDDGRRAGRPRSRVPGPSVTRVATDRAENVRVHAALNAAVAAAL